jgi:hypothetical protein
MRSQTQKLTNKIWQPTKKQLEFLKTGNIFEVAYLGGAGSGKSSVLLIDACRQMNHGDAKSVIFRRTTKELRQLIDYSYKVYRPLGATFKVQESCWIFPSGGKVYFSHMENEMDKFQHDGFEYSAGVYFDEITHFTETQYLYLHSRARSSNPKILPRVRCTGTPVGKHIDWVRKRFIEIGSYKIYKDPDTQLSRLYIPATLDDNPYLQKSDPLYEQRLKLQGNKLYQALRFGDFSQIEGTCFPEIGEMHIIDQYIPTPGQTIIRGFDWGFTAPFATVWIAEDQDHNLIVFKEWIGTKDGSNKGLMMSADQVATTIREIEEKHKINPYYAPSDPAIWGKQNVGDSIGDIFVNKGLFMERANNDRIMGTQQLHMRLQIDPYSQKPKLMFTKDCKYTIQAMQNIEVDHRNPEVYATTGFDHPVDALRYAVMSKTLDQSEVSDPETFGDRETTIEAW